MVYAKYGIHEREVTLRKMYQDSSDATTRKYSALGSLSVPHRGVFWAVSGNHTSKDNMLDSAVEIS